MPWFQVDDDYPTHPGTLANSLAARGLWVTAGAWCSKRLTDVVPDPVLTSFGSNRELEAELRASGVWKRVRGAYQFTQEGLCKIPVKETVVYQRQLKRDRQSRWREGRRRRSVDASTRASPLESITSTKERTPLPPAEAGGHHGQHPNCRACRTNPRGEPPPTPTPPPYQPPNGRRVASEDVAGLLAETRRAIAKEVTDA